MMIIDIFELIGILGLILITIGVLLINEKHRKKQYFLFILGGIGLLVYSIDIGNMIFIVLQTVFTLSSVYGLFKSKKK